jgi:hypothetical protein
MKRRRNSKRSRMRARRGLAHSTSLVLAMPLYLCLTALVIEIVLLNANHVALVSSVDRVSHQFTQWIAHRDALLNSGTTFEEQIHREVCKSLLPFAMTKDRPTVTNARRDGMQRQLVESRFNTRGIIHFGDRWERIANATEVLIKPVASPPGYQVFDIQVSYESPFWTPWIGRMLGTKSKTGANHYVWELKQSTQVTVLADQWKRTNIGIEYSPHLSKKR